MRLVVYALSLSFFALSTAAADHKIAVQPEGPTTATAIELLVPYICSSPVTGAQVERTGAQIVVQLQSTFQICDPPLVQGLHPVPIGTLPAGEYHVLVSYAGDGEWADGSFLVRNAERGRFEVHPFGVPATRSQDIVIVPSTDTLLCKVADCATTTVWIDGVELPKSAVKPGPAGGLKLTIGDRAAGLHNVRVRVGDFDETVLAAFYVFDRSSPPHPSVFERILFPVLQETAGAFGSQWISEAMIANPTEWDIDSYNMIENVQCIDFPCRERIQAGEYRSFRGSGFPNGVALLVPRDDAGDLAFSLRVRDTSRQAKGLGVGVPVVREKDMFRKAISLLDIPVDPRFRAKLRFYSFNPYGTSAGGFQAFLVPPNGVHFPLTFTRQISCAPNCDTIPFYAELDLPPGTPDERVNLFIRLFDPGSQLSWAVVSVTNNETQEVTLVLPSGEGARPCLFCG